MEWEQRLSDLWASIDDHSEQVFLSKMELLVAELPANSAVAAFERAASLDSTGHSDLAVPLYRQALELGLQGQRRRLDRRDGVVSSHDQVPALDGQLRAPHLRPPFHLSQFGDASESGGWPPVGRAGVA